MKKERCNEIIDLYKNLLLQKNNFDVSIKSDLSKENIKKTLDNLKSINLIIYSVKNIIKEGLFRKEKENYSNFYKNILGIDINFDYVEIPEKPKEGKWELIFVDNTNVRDLLIKIKENNIYPIYNGEGPCFNDIISGDLLITDLQKRALKGKPYAIWVEDSINAKDSQINSEMFQGKTFFDIEKIIDESDNYVETITLKEYLLLFLHTFFIKNNRKDFCDYAYYTLCSGSVIDSKNFFTPMTIKCGGSITKELLIKTFGKNETNFMVCPRIVHSIYK